MEREFLTCRDLMNRYKLSRPAIRSLVSRGILPQPLKIGKSLRWNIEEIKEYEEKARIQNTREGNS